MFFDEKFVSSNTLKRVWKSANNQQSTEYNEDCCLPKLCSKLKRWMNCDDDDPRSRLSLRSSAALIGGTAKIYKQEMKRLVEDVCKLDEDLTFHKRRRHDSDETYSDHSSKPSDSSVDKIPSKKSVVRDSSTYPDDEDSLKTEDSEDKEIEFQFDDEESKSSTNDTGSNFTPASNDDRERSDSTNARLEIDTSISISSKTTSAGIIERNVTDGSNSGSEVVHEFLSSSLDFDVLENVVAEVMAEREKDNCSTQSVHEVRKITNLMSPEIMLRHTNQNLNAPCALIHEDSLKVKSPILITTNKGSRLYKSNNSQNSNDDDDDIQEMEYCEQEDADDERSDNDDDDFYPKLSVLMSESTSESLEEETNSSETYIVLSQRNHEIQSYETEHEINISSRQSKDKLMENVNQFPTVDSEALPEPELNRTAMTVPEFDNNADNNAVIDNEEAVSTTYSEIKEQATQTLDDEEVFDLNSPFGHVMIYDNYHSRIPSKIIFSSLANDALNF